jgi:hypothetical protein
VIPGLPKLNPGLKLANTVGVMEKLYKMGKPVEAKKRWEKVLQMNDPIAALKAEASLRDLNTKR